MCVNVCVRVCVYIWNFFMLEIVFIIFLRLHMNSRLRFHGLHITGVYSNYSEIEIIRTYFPYIYIYIYILIYSFEHTYNFHVRTHAHIHTFF